MYVHTAWSTVQTDVGKSSEYNKRIILDIGCYWMDPFFLFNFLENQQESTGINSLSKETEEHTTYVRISNCTKYRNKNHTGNYSTLLVTWIEWLISVCPCVCPPPPFGGFMRSCFQSLERIFKTSRASRIAHSATLLIFYFMNRFRSVDIINNIWKTFQIDIWFFSNVILYEVLL